MRKIYLVIISLLLSSCVNIWQIESGDLLPDDAIVLFGVSVHGDYIEDDNLEESSCFSSAIVSSCKPSSTYLNVGRLSRLADSSAGRIFLSISGDAHIIKVEPLQGEHLSFRIIHPISNRESESSKIVVVKAPDRAGNYYVGHIFLEKNGEILVKSQLNSDINKVKQKFSDYPRSIPSQLDYFVVPYGVSFNEIARMANERFNSQKK